MSNQTRKPVPGDKTATIRTTMGDIKVLLLPEAAPKAVENFTGLAEKGYYDGIIFKIPQLCMKDSYMGQRAMLNGIGLECDPFKADFTDAIFSYYRSLQLDQFNKNCDMELECVLKEYQTGEQIINECTL